MDEDTKILRNVDKNLLDLFWKLAENNSNTRIDASIAIIRILLKKQNAYSSDGMCKDLEYTIERLVKGLASSRGAARLGYTLVLTEILKQLIVVEVEDILEHIRKHLSVSSKLDKRDMVFGQLFAYSAIVESGRLNGHSHLSFVITSLYHLSLGKNYILKACYEIFVKIFSQITEENFKESIWPHLKEDFNCGWEKCSADIAWLFFLCFRMFPNSVNRKFLKKKWNSEDIFSKENVEHLKRIMKQTTAVLPMIHPLCTEFLKLVMGRKDFSEIWGQVIDENLFETDQKEKSFVVFEMIKELLPNTQKKKVVKCVLSARFCTMFTRSFLNKKHPMNPAANQLAKFLCDYVIHSTVPDIQIIVLKAFLQPTGTVRLDELLKKKEVSVIISHLLPDAVKDFVEVLKFVVLRKKTIGFDDDEEAVIHKSHQAVTQIGTLVSHPATILDIDWRLDVIKFLFLNSFFIVKEPASHISHCEKEHEPLPEPLRIVCANSFTKALDSLYRKTEGQTSPMEQFVKILLSITEYADQLMEATESISPVFPVEKVQDSWQQMKHIVHKLAKQCKKDGKAQESRIFEILFLQLGLQLFLDMEHVPGVLEELHVCCKKALKVRKHLDERLEEDEPPWIGVVVDIMLSLLSKSSHHMRRLVTSVFPYLCPFITREALQQILDVVNIEKTSEESMLVDESDEDDVSENDVEFESGSSSEDDDVSNNKADEADNEFKQRVRIALGSTADVSGSESEVVLTDSEMFKFDDVLYESFLRQKKIGHTQLSTEDKMMLHFRVKCLDLVIVYLKSSPPMNRVMQCIQPVLSIYEYGTKGKQQSPLFLKAVSTLQILTRIKKFHHCNEIEAVEFENLLDSLITKCHKETNTDVAKKLYLLCIFTVLCCRKLEIQSASSEKQQENCKYPTYLEKYIAALDAFVNQSSSHMLPQFFISLMNACPELAWHFVEPLRIYAFGSNNRIYKRTQCLGLMLEALKFSKGQKSVTTMQWSKFGKSIIPSAVEILKSSISNAEIKPRYTTELLDIIYTSHRVVKEKTAECLLREHSELVPLLNGLTSSQVKLLQKKGSSLRRKIILCLGGSVDSNSTQVQKNKKAVKLKEKNGKSDSKEADIEIELNSESEKSEKDAQQQKENTKEVATKKKEKKSYSERKSLKRKLDSELENPQKKLSFQGL